MSPEDRLLYLTIGIVIGLVLGYLTRGFQTGDFSLKVDKTRKGWRSWTSASNLIPVLLFVMVAYAAVSTGLANNRVTENQRVQERVTACIRVVLTDTVDALNERTTFNQQQTLANARLQEAQGKYLSVRLDRPSADDPQVVDALAEYSSAVRAYVKAVAPIPGKQAQTPYPTTNQFDQCIEAR